MYAKETPSTSPTPPSKNLDGSGPSGRSSTGRTYHPFLSTKVPFSTTKTPSDLRPNNTAGNRRPTGEKTPKAAITFTKTPRRHFSEAVLSLTGRRDYYKAYSLERAGMPKRSRRRASLITQIAHGAPSTSLKRWSTVGGIAQGGPTYARLFLTSSNLTAPNSHRVSSTRELFRTRPPIARNAMRSCPISTFARKRIIPLPRSGKPP